MIEYQLYCSITLEDFILLLPVLKEGVSRGFYKYTALRIRGKKQFTKRIVDLVYKIHEDFENKKGVLDLIYYITYFHTDLEFMRYLKSRYGGAEFNIINNYIIIS